MSIHSPDLTSRRHLLLQRPSCRVPITALLSLVALLFLPSLARAQQTASPNRCPAGVIPPEERKDHLAMTLLGVACFERGEFGQALHYYREAYAQSQEPLLEAAIGRSLHELGLLGLARIYYNLYLEHERGDVDGRKRIEERLARLEVQLEESSAQVSIDAWPGTSKVFVRTHEGHREYLGTTPLQITLEPRSYTFTLEQTGFHTDHFKVNLSPGEEEQELRELVPQRSTFNLTTRATRRVGTTTMLVGAPILLTGSATRLIDWPFTHRESHALMILGASTIITGAIVTAIGYRREKKLRLDHTELTLSPSLSPTHTGLTLTW